MDETEEWIGKAVSIECHNKLGIFQGIIQHITQTELTITRAFRNGVPLRQQNCSVTFKNTDIAKLKIIQAPSCQSVATTPVINKPTPVKQPNFAKAVSRTIPVMTQLESGGLLFPNTMPSLYNASDINKQLSALTLNLGNPTYSSNTNVEDSSNGDDWENMAVRNFKASTFQQSYGNLIPPKVELKMGALLTPAAIEKSTKLDMDERKIDQNPFSVCSSFGSKQHDLLHNSGFGSDNGESNGNGSSCGSGNGNGNGKGYKTAIDSGNKSDNGSSSKNGNGSSNGQGNGNWGKRCRKTRRDSNMRQTSQTFNTSVGDPILNEDFDFEGNLALFDKKAVFNVIESQQDRKSSPLPKQRGVEEKYRHNENILVSEPLQLQQIESIFESTNSFVTDEGLIIPTIPIFVRSKIEICADRAGLTSQRQFDMLGRGAADLAIMLVGGARRLTPANSHQWPVVVVICDKQDSVRTVNIGASVGRQLAAHGLKVILYIEKHSNMERGNTELFLFRATGNKIVSSEKELPRPDLVIISSNVMNLEDNVTAWLNVNRSSVLAIDPPPCGIRDVNIKYSIIPTLPLNGISSKACGKLYLCNLGIPATFYTEAGLKYKSPFGHKYVIPIHAKD